MKKIPVILAYCFFFLIMMPRSFAQMKDVNRIIVSADGKGDYRSVQGAINSLSDSAATPRVIFIRKGTYTEKIYLEKHNVILEGEDRDKTIITHAIARDEWRCLHNEDWGVATLNVDGDDITFKNLTIINSYGFDNKTDRTIYCPSDTTLTKQKIIKPGGHQMAIRTMNTTRMKAINCRFKAFAGDTVSPWNVANGMFYFKDCIMEGGVDFYCPRGWAYAEGCSFFANTGDAAIWHDGSKVKDSKTVLVNCSFDGYDGFKLGRYHRDAQFYLLNCRFSSKMADKPIYLVPTNNPILWGQRIYYYNCHRETGDFNWFADNFQAADGMIKPVDINPAWVFGNRWNPLKN
ncbi:MAG TPA: pectinesterase family protein [Ferruginibacter sp.]|nr:pectinesterase family protein [Ferruginibacter sp.]